MMVGDNYCTCDIQVLVSPVRACVPKPWGKDHLHFNELRDKDMYASNYKASKVIWNC